MKKKVLNYLALSMVMALGLAAPAAAQDFSSFYLTPKIMTSYQKADMDSGGSERSSVFGLGFAVGTDLSYSTSMPIRVEGEYLYHGNQTFRSNSHSHEVSAHSIMANAFVDFHTDTTLTPYAGGGFGLSYLNNKVNSNSNSDSAKSNRWNFAWNLGGGVAWSLNESLALDLGYRYMDLGKTQGNNLGSPADVSLTAHEFGLGLRITGF
jgi:opacity protein-like surface antigen